MVKARSPGASCEIGFSRQSAASILRWGFVVRVRWWASPVYPIAARSRSTRKHWSENSASPAAWGAGHPDLRSKGCLP